MALNELSTTSDPLVAPAQIYRGAMLLQQISQDEPMRIAIETAIALPIAVAKVVVQSLDYDNVAKSQSQRKHMPSGFVGSPGLTHSAELLNDTRLAFAATGSTAQLDALVAMADMWIDGDKADVDERLQSIYQWVQSQMQMYTTTATIPADDAGGSKEDSSRRCSASSTLRTGRRRLSSCQIQ
jgi:hypothetical protein